MIDDIVEMVLKEARRRPRKDLVSNIYSVALDINSAMMLILADLREEERRKEKDENKG